MKPRRENLWALYKDEPDPVAAIAKDMQRVYNSQGDPLGFYPNGLPLTIAQKFATKVWKDVVEHMEGQDAEVV